VAAYTDVLALAPDLVAAYVERGLIYREMGDSARALADFEHALRRNPTYGPAYYGRGWVRHGRGDFAGELQDAQQGLEFDTDPAHAGMYYRRIGAARHGLKQYPAALAAYDQALAQWPDDEGTLYNRGLCYADMGQAALARADFTRALELDPDWAWAAATRGHVQLRQGALPQALADFDLAIRSDPSYISAYLGRAEVYAAQHDPERALADYRHVLRLTTNPRVRQMVEQQIAALEAARRRTGWRGWFRR
jgi:tetratricopeptide (TPR) repeat protein